MNKIVLTALVLTTTAAAQSVASSVSRHGITWTFDGDHPVGRFVNGDWWVVGPVRIVDITPGSRSGARIMNGSMIDPSPRNTNQGYDNDIDYNTYQPNLNVGLDVSASNPLTIGPGHSLVSTISLTQPGQRPQLRTAAVLTVLGGRAPASAFRPPYSGTDKTLRYHEGQLDYSKLRALPRLPSAPSMASAVRDFDRVWLDHKPGWTARYLHPEENMPDYGRDMVRTIGTGSLMLNLDYTNAEKRDLLVRFVQLGIDLYGIVQAGGERNWTPLGGHTQGRKWPILFAGMVLNDARMAGIGERHDVLFAEDDQTFIVRETNPGVYNNGHGGYGPQHVGMPEWGIRHATEPHRDNVDWGARYRRCCTANAWVGQILSAHLMFDARRLWNHEPIFLYQDRYMDEELRRSGRNHYFYALSDFHRDMWEAYRDNAAGGGSGNGGGVSGPRVVAPTVHGGGRFHHLRALEMRVPSGDVRYTLDGTDPTETSRLANGPVFVQQDTELRARTYDNGLASPVVVTRATRLPDAWADFDGEGTGNAVEDAAHPARSGRLVGADRATGRVGQGFDLHGGTSRVELGNWSFPTDRVTVAAWFRADGFPHPDVRIVSKASGSAEQDHVLMVSTFVDSGQRLLRFRLKTNGQTSTLIASRGTVEAGRWHHVAAVYDGQVMELFLDGRSVGAMPANGRITATGDPVWIGNNPGGADRGFDGLVDEVLVFDRDLTGAEIAGLASERSRPGVQPAGRSSTACGRDIVLEAIGIPDEERPTFEVGGAHAPASTVGILVTGTRRASRRQFGARLHVGHDPDTIYFPFLAGPEGTWQVSVPMISGQRGNQYFMQAVFLTTGTCPGSGALASSNGLRLTVQ